MSTDQNWMWNSQGPEDINGFVHELIEAQAVTSPIQVAVASWDGELTYAQLEAFASKLAGHLKSCNVGPDVCVPICMRKSLWTVVSIIAVLKAGAAFVLLDASLPSDRLKAIVDQTDAPVLLTSPDCLELCQQIVADLQVLVIHQGSLDAMLQIVKHDVSRLEPPLAPSNAAYVMFTSGSTGVPKGVIIEHSQLTTWLVPFADNFGWSNKARVLQFASYAFDVFILELIPTLAHGGTVCIPSDWDRQNDLVGAMHRMEITHAILTPTVFQGLDSVGLRLPPSLHTLVLGGEVVSQSLLERWATKIPRLVVAYGPTETTVFCTWADVSPAWRSESHAIAPGEIGRPFGVKTWVVKQGDINTLAEVGDVGELLLEGPLLARGYLNRPEATAAAFLPAPEWLRDDQAAENALQRTSRRVYRTGDLVRRLEDGCLCCVGRIDSQVKIRGQRLELSEVEKHISDAVRVGFATGEGSSTIIGSKAIVVELIKLKNGVSPQLVAFLCLESTQPLGCFNWERALSEEAGGDITEAVGARPEETTVFAQIVSRIMERIRRALPAYAVPSVFVPLTSLPLTVSTKTDRKKLRLAAMKFSIRDLMVFSSERSTMISGDDDCVPARARLTDKEVELAALWSRLFGLEDIDNTANFFVLGGESLSAMKLVVAARAAGLDLTMDMVFRYPVLSEMALRMGSLKPAVNGKGQEIDPPPFSLLEFGGDSEKVAALCEEASVQCNLNTPPKTTQIQDIFPASSLQAGLLLSYLKNPGAYMLQSVHHIPTSARLDRTRLKSAWENVVRRESCLRSRFVEHDGDIYQVVLGDEPLRWSDLKGEHDLNQLLVLEQGRRFQLGEPMSWLTLVPTARGHNASAFALLWTIHHALVDGWSTSLIISEVEKEYFYLGQDNCKDLDGDSLALSIKSRPQLPATTPPYQRFIRHCINQEQSKSSKLFWEKNLEGTQQSVFPVCPSAAAPQPTSVLEQHIVIPLKSPLNCTPATLVQAAWFLLLGIHSGGVVDPEDDVDIVTGITLNGRSPSVDDIENIAGPTITTAPFRMPLSPNLSLTRYLQSVQEHYLSILAHEQFGLQNIQRLSPSAETACHFQSLLVIQSVVEGAKCSGTCEGSQGRLFEIQTESYTSVDYALNMDCELKGMRKLGDADGAELPIFFKVIFDPHIISEAKMQRMFVQLEHLMKELADASCGEQQLKQVRDLLGAACEADLKQIEEWNETLTYPCPLVTSKSCVHDLIKKQCQLSPDVPAVCAWDGELSYDRLDSLSSLLAVHLQQGYCIKPEALVAICFEKSLWTVVAMLAVLKAGGGCVPIDPLTPPGRLRDILGKMGERFVGLVLTSCSHHDRFSALVQEARVLAVDQNLMDSLKPVATAAMQRQPPLSTASPGNVAFVVFTSGSTGTPKGIVLEHQAFCSSALAHGSFWGLGPHSRVLQFAAHTFDVSIGDMFATLIHGGCVCIPSDHDRMNNLAVAINALNINHANLTPTVSAYMSPEEVPGLKLLANVGEALSKTVMERWAGHVELYNMYGPAECTIYSIIKGNIQQHQDPNNIGAGVGAKGWLVDPGDIYRLVPIGATGEILIEGPNLARGYVGDEDLTNKSFVWDPAWSRSGPKSSVSRKGRRFYRTGDLATLNDDGSMTFIGRNDGQVKLRGQRLELGEIESQLHHLLPPSTRLAAAVVSPMGEPQKKLLTVFLSLPVEADYLASAEEKQTKARPVETLIQKSPVVLENFKTTVLDVDARLKTVLPSYMMPSAYLPLTSLPVSTSGKTDRRQLQDLAACLPQDQLSAYLPQREYDVKDSNQASTSPYTKEESILHRLWTGLFSLARELHVNDHFFRLGGDSMAAMRLVSLARQQGMTLTVEKIFRHPILRDLACVTMPPNMSMGEPKSVKANDDVDTLAFSLLAGKDVELLRSQAVQQCNVQHSQIQDIYPVLAVQERFMTGAFMGSIANRTLSICRQKKGPRDEQSQLVFALPDSLDLQTFEAAWSAVIRRHPILRTRMIETNDGIFQVVIDEDPVWTRSNAPLRQFVEQDRANAMVFGDPLIRLSLVISEGSSVGSGEDQAFFVISACHAIYDGFSFGKMWEEVEADYSRHMDRRSGGPAGLPPPPPGLQMNQLVKQRLQADVEAAKAFWRSELSDAVTVPVVPYDRLQRRVLTKTRRRATIDIQTSRLPSSEVTLSTMIFVSAALTLSHDYDSPDIIFEALLSGRSGDIPGIEDVMGPAMTCLPVRIRLGQIAQQERVTLQSVLLETQTLLHERLVKHEHVGWWDLVQIDEFRSLLNNVAQININPNPYLELGKSLGLKLEDSFSTNEVFYAMSSFIQDEQLVLMVSSDDDYVDGQDVERHLRKWSMLLTGILRAQEAQQLKDVTLSNLLDSLAL